MCSHTIMTVSMSTSLAPAYRTPAAPVPVSGDGGTAICTLRIAVKRAGKQGGFIGIPAKILTAALDELAEAVRTSGRSYDATEQENARALGAVDPGAGSLLRGSF